MTQNSLSTDVLLHASAADAGKSEIDEYLRTSGLVPGKRCFKRILKRVRHSNLYRDGKLTVRARILAVVLLSVLACGFAVLGFCAARLVDDIFTVQDVGQYFSFVKDNGKKSASPVIGEYLEPRIGDNDGNILVKSSQLYNVEYYGDGEYIYYTQTPKAVLSGTQKEEVSDSGLYVLVNGNKALVSVSATDSGKIFEISWSDEYHSYTIFGAHTMEDAVRFAQSVYDNNNTDSKAE